MRQIILGLFCAILFTLPAVAGGTGIIIVESSYSVPETLDRLTKIFARVDHAAGAKKVGKELAPTQLLIFGNPKLGTPLMLSNRNIGLDLPLKALAWQDSDGKVRVSYNDPAYLKTRHGISDRDPVFMKMTGVLKKLIGKAVSK